MQTLPLIRLTFTFTLGLVASGCAGLVGHQPPPGKLLYSYRQSEGAFTGPPTKVTGLFFFIDDLGIIRGEELVQGKVTNKFECSKLESEQLRAELTGIAFEAFDFEQELRAINERIWAERADVGPIILDGWQYELRFVFGDIDYTLTAWNPDPPIDFHAKRSPRVAKLKALRDTFSRHVPRRRT